MKKQSKWSLLADDVEDAVRAVLEGSKWKPFIKRQKCTPRLVQSHVADGARKAPWPRQKKVVQMQMNFDGGN